MTVINRIIFFFSTNEIVHANSLKRLEQINASGIKRHYVSFNFGRDLGELLGLVPRFNSRCPLQIVFTHMVIWPP